MSSDKGKAVANADDAPESAYYDAPRSPPYPIHPSIIKRARMSGDHIAFPQKLDFMENNLVVNLIEEVYSHDDERDILLEEREKWKRRAETAEGLRTMALTQQNEDVTIIQKLEDDNRNAIRLIRSLEEKIKERAAQIAPKP